MPPYPVHIAYHWFDQTGRTPVVFDGMRTMLPLPLEQAERGRQLAATVQAPHQPGVYNLSMTLVQEGFFWFDQAANNACAHKTICVI